MSFALFSKHQGSSVPKSLGDLTGKRFGMLVVVKRDYRFIWLCQCDCGTVCRVRSYNLCNGNTKSCGCQRVKHRHTTHTTVSPTYSVWRSMIQRCTNTKVNSYKLYGGRGITVCERWSDFSNFVADMGERPPGLSLDRRDNDKGYSKANCRWATAAEQTANRRPARVQK